MSTFKSPFHPKGAPCTHTIKSVHPTFSTMRQFYIHPKMVLWSSQCLACKAWTLFLGLTKMYFSRSAVIINLFGILKIFVKLSFVNRRSVFNSRFCFRFCWECETGLMRCWWRMAAHSEMVRSQIFAPPPPNWASSPSPAVTTSNHLNLKDPPIHRTPNNSNTH